MRADDFKWLFPQEKAIFQNLLYAPFTLKLF